MTQIACVLIVGALALVCGPANAEPKTITLDNCAKVSIEQLSDIRNTGTSQMMSVKCVGDEPREPVVLQERHGSITLYDGAILPFDKGIDLRPWTK